MFTHPAVLRSKRAHAQTRMWRTPDAPDHLSQTLPPRLASLPHPSSRQSAALVCNIFSFSSVYLAVSFYYRISINLEPIIFCVRTLWYIFQQNVSKNDIPSDIHRHRNNLHGSWHKNCAHVTCYVFTYSCHWLKVTFPDLTEKKIIIITMGYE